MPKNRYDDLLREGNQLIIDLSPCNYVLRIELSLELKKITKIGKSGTKVLEIGVGEGDLTKYVLKNNPGINIDCLDISKEMIEICRKNLTSYTDEITNNKDNNKTKIKINTKIKYITEDALVYLQKNEDMYDVILSAWTIHNFVQKDKNAVFRAIYSSLRKGGKMLIMDKFYPDSKKEQKILLDLQLSRYRYLDKKLRSVIVRHEQQDLSKNYLMEESSSINLLQRIGFKNIKILDRVERDILLIAEK